MSMIDSPRQLSAPESLLRTERKLPLARFAACFSIFGSVVPLAQTNKVSLYTLEPDSCATFKIFKSPLF